MKVFHICFHEDEGTTGHTEFTFQPEEASDWKGRGEILPRSAASCYNSPFTLLLFPLSYLDGKNSSTTMSFLDFWLKELFAFHHPEKSLLFSPVHYDPANPGCCLPSLGKALELSVSLFGQLCFCGQFGFGFWPARA